MLVGRKRIVAKPRKAPRHVSIGAKRAMHDAEIDRLKQAVLKRHHEWLRPPGKTHYFLYFITILMIFSGIFLISSRAMALSPIAIAITFVITVLLAASFIMLLQYRMGDRSQKSLEERIENEILEFKIEGLSKR